MGLRLLLAALLALSCAGFRPGLAWADWSFSDATAAAGITHEHRYEGPLIDEQQANEWVITGGAAAADYDRDGDPDLYAVRGDHGPNVLYQNQGDGTFVEVAASAGVAGAPVSGSGPVFADIDGDGWLDLLVGGVARSDSVVYRNRGDGTFEDVTAASGFLPTESVYSLALADYDRDDDLDIAAVHWVYDARVTLWQNDGTGVFTEVTAAAGLEVGRIDGFSPTFADINGDGWQDLLVGADFGSSRVFQNDGDGTFTETTTPVIDDENGMGAAAFDFDNDGDVDWLVTSIWDPNQIAEGNWGVTGNRFYRNQGTGVFEDWTTPSGLREGYWGWGACAQDLNQDGYTDVFHVNGFPVLDTDEFNPDFSRLFVADGAGSYVESSAALGVVDGGQGRGALCFDFDGDGDQDIFVANNFGAPVLYRNDDPPGGWLRIRLSAPEGNTSGVGAVVRVTIGSMTQMREIRAGTNFVSAEPLVAHFGVGAAGVVDEVVVEWPDGTVERHEDVGVNQELSISKAAPEPVPGPGPLALGLLLLGLAAMGTRRLRAASQV